MAISILSTSLRHRACLLVCWRVCAQERNLVKNPSFAQISREAGDKKASSPDAGQK